LIPIYYTLVHVLHHPGYNMALWNLHERRLTASAGGYIVNEKDPLVLYHFSGVLGSPERILRDYSRFQGADRSDLHELYASYRSALAASCYASFSTEKCFYSAFSVGNTAQAKMAAPSIPHRIKNRIQKLVRADRLPATTIKG
jgi:hypothetical protein